MYLQTYMEVPQLQCWAKLLATSLTQGPRASQLVHCTLAQPMGSRPADEGYCCYASTSMVCGMCSRKLGIHGMAPMSSDRGLTL